MSTSRCTLVGRFSGSFVTASLAALTVLVAQAMAARAAATPWQEDHEQEGADSAAAASQPYPLGVDPVTGERLGDPDSQIVIVHQGRELRFASSETAGRFREDPGTVLARLDARIIADQLPIYPLESCIVSGETFPSSMGEPVNVVVGNRLVRFCCAMCEPKFREDPEGYLARLDEAVLREQRETYPLDTCVVSGERLGASMGKPVDFIFANRLVRLCCNLCKADFAKDPAGYLSKLDRASRGDGKAAPEAGHHDDHEEGHPYDR